MPSTGLNASSPIGSARSSGLLKLARIGHELPRDRIVRIAGVDQSAIAGVIATA